MMDTVAPSCVKTIGEQGEIVSNGSNNEENSDVRDATVSLSKRAQRKLLKRQQWLETRPERRAKEKAKKRAKIERIRQEKGFDKTFSEHRKRLKQKKMSESLCKVTVVLDMAYENLMNQKDLGKCLKQLLHCYSINRRLAQPLQFHISSFNGERLKKEMERHQGYENWDCVFHSESYFDAFTSPSRKDDPKLFTNATDSDYPSTMHENKKEDVKNISKEKTISDSVTKSNSTEQCISSAENISSISKKEILQKSPNISDQGTKSEKDLVGNQTNVQINPERIVYLTSESENVLEGFDPNSVYIIGGLVDHNNHKGICHRLAVEKGVSHARFPIQEAGIEMKTRQVLTIDHVFRIIAAVASEGKTWKEALMDTLPDRKGAKEVQEDKTNIENVIGYDNKDIP